MSGNPMPSDFSITAERRARLASAVEKFSGLKVLLVGDLMLDVYIWGEVRRISPEAPVPVVEVVRETSSLGGAANVAHNLASLGATALTTGLIGDDDAGRRIVELFEQSSISTSGLVEEKGRPTSVKTRIMAQNQQVVRYDRETSAPSRPDSTARIVKFLRENLDGAGVAVLSDYAKGVVNSQLVGKIRSITGKAAIPVIVDPKIQNFKLYHSFWMVTPNHHEAAWLSGIPIVDEESLNAAGIELFRRLECENLLITRGKDGMSIFRNKEKAVHIPTLARQVYDVTGAGDTVAAVLALGTAAGLSVVDASILANCAAGLVVARQGTAAVSAAQLMEALGML